jgi:hypothetical protein
MLQTIQKVYDKDYASGSSRQGDRFTQVIGIAFMWLAVEETGSIDYRIYP